MSGSPVALNVVDSALVVACRTFVPASVSSVQLPTAATPTAFVNCVGPVMLPAPGFTANVTDAPPIGLPY